MMVLPTLYPTTLTTSHAADQQQSWCRQSAPSVSATNATTEGDEGTKGNPALSRFLARLAPSRSFRTMAIAIARRVRASVHLVIGEQTVKKRRPSETPRSASVSHQRRGIDRSGEVAHRT